LLSQFAVPWADFLQKKYATWWQDGFCCFAGVLRGVLEKMARRCRVFCGELWWDVRQTWTRNCCFVAVEK
jgi:hypothetical protein